VAIASQMAVGAQVAIDYQTAVPQQCPQCRHRMIIIDRQSRAYLIFLLLGLPLLIIPIIGWFMGGVMIMIGIVLRLAGKGKVRYQCPNCNFSNN
jgi:predicted RNA-binding Zn-ribbon protein involved in translation (DUF1610 family)